MLPYERLSPQDASFVFWERRETPMHVGALGILEAKTLLTADGGIDADRIAKHVESRLHLLPRYRQRLRFLPIDAHPAWVDDEHFDLHHHLRRAALPRPGGEGELKEFVARVLSERLDRDKPLWEMWIIEGLEGGRCALLTKVHHCMVDGTSGMNLLTLLMSQQPDEDTPPAPQWSPAPAPTTRDFLLGETARGIEAARSLAAGAWRAARTPLASLRSVRRAGEAVAQALDAGVRFAATTHLNQPIGPYRRIEWLALDLAKAKQVKQKLGGTVNDVVLATVAGALHRFLGGRSDWRARFDYRIVIPVNMRPPGDTRAGGNCVSAYFLSLPVSDADPRRRYRIVRSATERLKDSRAAEGIDLLTRALDYATAPPLLRLGGQLISWLRPYNLIVTNVPGPQMALYVLGARLVELYPLLPLFDRQGLGIAVLSYCGQLGIGLIGDRELAPDLAGLRDALDDAFAELVDAAAPRR